MSIFVLQQRIEEYRASGFNVSTLEAELETRIAYPFGNFALIVVALALGVMLRRGRGASLAVGLLMAFGYYQLTAFAKSLAATGAGSTILLAWIPNLLFLIVGAYLAYRMD
jgi:lipopolysaccharide export system permease protein